MSTSTMADGGWTTNEKGWQLHPSQVARNRKQVAEALAVIEMKQQRARTCALCGQRVWALDKFGLCSKLTTAHKAWRAESLADMKNGMRV
ncbi:hypothetical protein ACYX8G_19275 [Microbacterium saperdae]